MNTRSATRVVSWAVASTLVAVSTGVHSRPPTAYPSKPLRVITSSPPGSPPDVSARIIGERLAAEIGQAVVIDNRPGAIGTIGLQAVAKASPDGYTFGIVSMSHVLAPSLLAQLPYDLVRDFVPVTQLAWASHVLVVRTSSPWKSVNDLVIFAKSRPGQITFASGGNATPAHVSGEFLKQRTGIDIRHIPFKGAIAGIAAVLGGDVDLMFAAATASGPYIKTGKLRALATPAPLRSPAFPDVPTMVELGFAGFEIREWHGVVAPAGTPREIVARIAGEIAKVTSASETKEQLALHGLEPPVQTEREAFGALLRSELQRWSGVVREARIRAD